MAKQRISAKRARALINYYLKNKAIIYYTGQDACAFYDLKKNKLTQITPNEYDFITHHTHSWSVYIAVFGKRNTGNYNEKIMMSDSHHFKSPYYQRDLTDYLNQEHLTLMKRLNTKHLIGVGWIAIPSGLELSEENAFNIFDGVGAFNVNQDSFDQESIFVTTE